MVEHYLALIEKEISKQKFGNEPDSLYEPIRYIMNIGGKRLRPLLTLLSYSLYKEDAEKIVSYAVGVEAFHNFTLMHDDIMDNATLRRGKATVHEKWNTNTAILSGDVMLVSVYDLFLGLEDSMLKQVLKTFNRCAAQVCEGQQWDMEFETREDVTQDEYIEMTRRKTAVLLGFSLELGAILAGAPQEDQRLLRNFGINAGIGFQLKDDWLDVFADKDKLGKQIGGDIVANKKTFLLLKALELAEGNQKIKLKNCIKEKNMNPLEKISSVTEIYNELSVPEIVRREIDHYFNEGLNQLDLISKKEKTNSLRKFTESLINRQF